ncbi:hypothetical protein HEB94_000641 [Actinopolymorpha pittospori]|uniref:Uncharacterized protein n=1 Tax=Actinopolymorpha pittospori TaxID=648752 RepID=A0A927MRZ1_9ACTN|nr:hypothetical protein [Actinopolymorpha pittospori]
MGRRVVREVALNVDRPQQRCVACRIRGGLRGRRTVPARPRRCRCALDVGPGRRTGGSGPGRGGAGQTGAGRHRGQRRPQAAARTRTGTLRSRRRARGRVAGGTRGVLGLPLNDGKHRTGYGHGRGPLRQRCGGGGQFSERGTQRRPVSGALYGGARRRAVRGTLAVPGLRLNHRKHRTGNGPRSRHDGGILPRRRTQRRPVSGALYGGARRWAVGGTLAVLGLPLNHGKHRTGNGPRSGHDGGVLPRRRTQRRRVLRALYGGARRWAVGGTLAVLGLPLNHGKHRTGHGHGRGPLRQRCGGRGQFSERGTQRRRVSGASYGRARRRAVGGTLAVPGLRLNHRKYRTGTGPRSRHDGGILHRRRTQRRPVLRTLHGRAQCGRLGDHRRPQGRDMAYRPRHPAGKRQVGPHRPWLDGGEGRLRPTSARRGLRTLPRRLLRGTRDGESGRPRDHRDTSHQRNRRGGRGGNGSLDTGSRGGKDSGGTHGRRDVTTLRSSARTSLLHSPGGAGGATTSRTYRRRLRHRLRHRAKIPLRLALRPLAPFRPHRPKQQRPPTDAHGARAGRRSHTPHQPSRSRRQQRMPEAAVEGRVLPGGEPSAEGEAVADSQRSAGDGQLRRGGAAPTAVPVARHGGTHRTRCTRCTRRIRTAVATGIRAPRHSRAPGSRPARPGAAQPVPPCHLLNRFRSYGC